MSNHGNIKKGLFSAAAHQSSVQLTERCLLKNGIQIYGQYFFITVHLLVRTGICDYVRLCHYLAADLKEDASDCGLCQQAGHTDLGESSGKADL